MNIWIDEGTVEGKKWEEYIIDQKKGSKVKKIMILLVQIRMWGCQEEFIILNLFGSRNKYK